MRCFLFFLIVFLTSCATVPSEQPIEAAPTVPSRTPLPKDPKVEVLIAESNLPNGLQDLKDRKIGAFFVYNLPDSFLIRAKHLFNPPDYAAQEVMNLQNDRQEWMDEMITTFCGSCENIKVQIPYKIFPEKFLLSLMDKASLDLELSPEDFKTISKHYPEADVVWIILGSEDYEQIRGLTSEETMISALAENTTILRNFIFDLKNRKWLHRAEFSVTDRDIIVYERAKDAEVGLTRRANILSEGSRDQFWPMPVGVSYDSPMFDDIYPYPPVPESSFIIKKALSSVGESLTP